MDLSLDGGTNFSNMIFGVFLQMKEWKLRLHWIFFFWSKKDGMNSSPTDFIPEEVRTKRMAIRMGHTPLARFSSVY